VAVPADATATARSTLIFLGSCTARSVGVGSRARNGPVQLEPGQDLQ